MDKKIFIVSAIVLAGIFMFAVQVDQKDDYLAWKETYGYKWSKEQDAYRRIIYQNNIQRFIIHNADPTQTYKMGVNQFTALSEHQFKNIYLNPRSPKNQNVFVEETSLDGFTSDIDWVARGMVTPVKDQGLCGSCWAFSAVGVLESWAKTRGETVNLSEQQLVDCSGKYGNKGCKGGQNFRGLAYVKDHGIADSKSYPYKGKNQDCKIDGGNFKISKVLTINGCDGILASIQQRVMGVSVDATKWGVYKQGIFKNCDKEINHDVTLVGYINKQYYKIKNSWGTTWGEQGYIRLAPGNTCGVCQEPSPWVQ